MITSFYHESTVVGNIRKVISVKITCSTPQVVYKEGKIANLILVLIVGCSFLGQIEAQSRRQHYKKHQEPKEENDERLKLVCNLAYHSHNEAKLIEDLHIVQQFEEATEDVQGADDACQLVPSIVFHLVATGEVSYTGSQTQNEEADVIDIDWVLPVVPFLLVHLDAFMS